MITYSVYDVKTGELTGAQIMLTGLPDPSAVPAGCSIVIGAFDVGHWVVDHDTGALCPRSPPPKDWRGRRARMAAEAMAIIKKGEVDQARPLREILAAQLSGMPATADDLAVFHNLKARIDAARARYLAVLATESAAQLDALAPA